MKSLRKLCVLPRYVLLLVLACALLLGGLGTGLVHIAQARSGRITIPKNWGNLRGGSSQHLYFENSAGTIRIYDVNSGALVRELERQ